jgi:broad specificity phosphatase PhoE
MTTIGNRPDPEYGRSVAKRGVQAIVLGTDGRITASLRRIGAEHPGERVIVVTHGGALSMALAAILDGDYTRWRRVMSNCAVSELVFEPAPQLLSFNETDHLEGL